MEDTGNRASHASNLIMAIAQAAKQAIIEQQMTSRHTELKKLKVTVTKQWRSPSNREHMGGVHASVKIPCVQVIAEATLIERDGTTLDL